MRRYLFTTREMEHTGMTLLMGTPTFSLRRSLKSCVSSSTDFWMLGGFGGAGALALFSWISSKEKEASSSPPMHSFFSVPPCCAERPPTCGTY